MKRREKLLVTALILGVLGAIGGYGVFAAFSATTSNASNTITAGTVKLDDNDAGASLYNVANVKPGQLVEKCIKVSYKGSLDAEVRLSTPSTLDTLAPLTDLTITPGTQLGSSFPDCTGFVPAASGPIYTSTLAGFAAAHSGWANGLAAFPGNQTKWTTNDSLVYRVSLTVQDTDAAQGLTTGSHELKWEARNL